LTVEQVAMVLNCNAHDVPILAATRLLKPLGNLPPNRVKYFATLEVEELRKDAKRLNRMTAATSQHWHNRNQRQKEGRRMPARHQPVVEQPDRSESAAD
jgi:hypothetical protein